MKFENLHTENLNAVFVDTDRNIFLEWKKKQDRINFILLLMDVKLFRPVSIRFGESNLYDMPYSMALYELNASDFIEIHKLVNKTVGVAKE